MQQTIALPAVSSLEITGFRGLEEVRLEGLGDLVVVVGPNGTGKTTLLEATLWALAAGYPASLAQLQGWRGLEVYLGQSGPSFLGVAKDSGCSIRLGGGLGDTIISAWIREESAPLEAGGGTVPSRPPTTHVVETRIERTGRVYQATHRWSFARATFDVDGEMPAPSETVSALVHATGGRSPGRSEFDAYSRAVSLGRKLAIIELLQLFEPELRDVEIIEQESKHFQVTMANGETMPAGMLGGGFGHWMIMSVNLCCYSGGWLGIDEPENGIHHTAMPRIIRSLAHFIVQNQTQVMLATHSDELLFALRECESILGEKLSLIQTRRRDGKIIVHHVRGEDAFLVLRSGFDVR